MGEDRSRIRTNPGVFARLRSFAFNILKANKANTLSQDRYRAALAGIDYLLSLITIPVLLRIAVKVKDRSLMDSVRQRFGTRRRRKLPVPSCRGRRLF